MKQLFTVLTLIVGAIGVFLTYTNPQNVDIQALNTEIDSYNHSLKQVREFEVLKERLLSEYNTFSPEEIKRLENMIPLNVDNVRLILEIDTVATTHGLDISDIQFQEEALASDRVAEGSEEENTDPTISLRRRGFDQSGVLMTFSTEASYNDFKLFMRDLERSLRIVDIQSIDADHEVEGLPQYTVTFRTYWLGNQ
jgi:hypothetical protein